MNLKRIALVAGLITCGLTIAKSKYSKPIIISPSKQKCSSEMVKVFHAAAINSDGNKLTFSISDVHCGSAKFIKNNRKSITVSDYSPGAAIAGIKFTPDKDHSEGGCYCFKLTVKNNRQKAVQEVKLISGH